MHTRREWPHLLGASGCIWLSMLQENEGRAEQSATTCTVLRGGADVRVIKTTNAAVGDFETVASHGLSIVNRDLFAYFYTSSHTSPLSVSRFPTVRL